ncbi:hypothetical protein [Streptomyces sp. NPDC048332]|uniref:hypothetical protein n=1 Tax=Streptomyces sp. NPDC048332 TaxID=3154619 RepID=UPI00343AC7A8
MSDARAPIQPSTGVLVHARKDRERAVGHWLLTAAHDIAKARHEWGTRGIALLRCGGVFTAVRIPADLVQAAAGTREAGRISTYLGEALSGPVFIDTSSQRYYALVPASTARRWDRRAVPGVECLGSGAYLGVPRPQRTDPEEARSYPCVPMDGPGDRCNPVAVLQVVTYGALERELAACRAAEEDHQ